MNRMEGRLLWLIINGHNQAMLIQWLGQQSFQRSTVKLFHKKL